MIKRRIERMERLALNEFGLKVKVRDGGKNLGMVANYKGNLHLIQSPNRFRQWCARMVDFVEPKPINLTERLAKIEEQAIARY